MKSELLILFSRKGCCLCETLEKKLSNISLTSLNPPLILSVLDIDSKEVSEDIRIKYSNEVPVMVIDSNILSKIIEFPRVSPRVKEDLLSSWIQKNLNIFFKLS
tara:strand:+ start:333 stop:644 length:312 start_codon:yes stop_codon:yes gene_type:complete